MDKINERLKIIRENISKSSVRYGRDPEDITLVVVSKTRSISDIEQVAMLGLKDFGENRVQEAVTKIPHVSSEVRWHMIGHLQRNKAGRALELFDMVQSITGARLAKALSSRAFQLDKQLEVLLQVNISAEPQKSGIPPEALEETACEIAGLSGLRILGLMSIGQYCPNPEDARGEFRKMRELFEDLKLKNIPGVEMKVLSMGMSGDYAVAIEEGANMVRIGQGIFGPRTV